MVAFCRTTRIRRIIATVTCAAAGLLLLAATESDGDRSRVLLVQEDIDNKRCPAQQLLDANKPWHWEGGTLPPTMMQARNHTSDSAKSPTVVMFRLEEESGTFHVKRTEQSLSDHWPEDRVCAADAVDGNSLKDHAGAEHITGIRFGSKLSLSQVGCFLSHLSIWRWALANDQPAISLESDAVALKRWSVDPETYKEYDILFTHGHNSIISKCQAETDEQVFEGMDRWYATGAMLFTNNNPERVRRVFQEELVAQQIDVPIDFWINAMWNKKKLKIGQLCPYHFQQIQDHASSIVGSFN